MSLSQGQDFFGATVAVLLEERLPTPPQVLIGRKFMFGAEFGSHHEILFGMITGLGISDEGGLEFYVSVPRFWGAPLKSIKRVNGEWMAYIDDPVPKNRFYKGEMTIFPESYPGRFG